MNLQEARQRLPELDGLSDSDAIDVIQQVYYPEIERTKIEKALGYKAPPPPPKARTWGDAAADSGISLLKGAIAVPEAAVGMADLVSGGRAGKFLANEDGAIGFRPQQARSMLDHLYSDPQKQAFQNVSNAEGVLGTLGAVAENPSVIPHAVMESLPLMGAGGVIGRGAVALAPRMVSAIGGSALGEGVVAAGSAAEQTRQQTADGLLTPQQAALSAATGVATTGLTMLGGKIAQKLGIEDIDTMLVEAGRNEAVRKGVVRSTIEGALSEGFLEELPQSVTEQVLQNMALNKPLDDGVDQAAVLGAITGAAMGGGVNLLHSVLPQKKDEQDPAKQAGDAVRASKVPEAGPMTRAVNAGTEMAAKQAEANVAAQMAAIDPSAPAAPTTLTGTDPASLVQPPENPLLAAAQEVQADRQGQARADAALARMERRGARDLGAQRDFGGGSTFDDMSAEEILNPSGKPFTTKRAAMIAAKRNGGGEIVEIEGGYAVRKPLNASTDSSALNQQKDDANIQQLASDESALPEPAGIGVSEVRSQGGDGLPAMGGQLRDVPGSDGRAAKPGSLAGSDRQLQGLRAGERALGDGERAGEQQDQLPNSGGVRKGTDGSAVGQREVAEPSNNSLPSGSWNDGRGSADSAAGSIIKSRTAAENADSPGADLDAQPVGEPDRDTSQRAGQPTAAGMERRSGTDDTGERGNGSPPKEEVAQAEWQTFPPETGSLNLPRAEMPQVKAEHRGAMVNFLNARGVEHEADEVDPADLKPTQAEYSLDKVKRAQEFGGTDRAILVSADGYVVDGHHQWLAKGNKGEPVKVIRLKAPIKDLLPLVREFPSSTVDESTANVQDQAQATEGAAPAQAPRAEAPAPAGGDGAAAGRVPDQGRTADAQAPGVAPAPSTREEGNSAREKALQRIERGTAYFGTAEKAQAFIDKFGLGETHEVVQAKPGRFEVRARAAQAEGRPGYDTAVEVDAKALQARLEQTRGAPLAEKPEKLAALRDGTASSSGPVEVAFRDSDGQLDVNDGRHRIALAAERGEKIKVFVDGKDADRLAAALAAQAPAVSPTKAPAAATQAADAAPAPAETDGSDTRTDQEPAGRETDERAEATAQPEPTAAVQPDAAPAREEVAPAAESQAAQDSGDGIKVIPGKGLIKGKFLADVDGTGVPGGPWETEQQARDAAAQYRTRLGQQAKESEAARARLDRIAEKFRNGQAVTDREIESLGLRLPTSDIKFFFPTAADLFGLSSRAIRPILGDMIRKGYTDMGAERESVPTRRALQAVGQSQTAEAAAPEQPASQPADPQALQEPAPPDALSMTPKQYHEAKLRQMAADNDVPLAEVREMYDTEGGRAENEQEWVASVVKAAEEGAALTRAMLDKLLEIRPNVRLPQTAIPEGYQRPEARKAEADEKQARIDNRKAAKASVKAASEQRIDDFGEKLEGARKDYATQLKDAMDVDVAAEPLSKSWPEPDYEKLIDGGADPKVVAVLRSMRDEIPTKPQKSWKLKGWVESVKYLRSVADTMLEGGIDVATWRAQVESGKTGAATRNVLGRADLYEAVGHGKSLKGITFQQHQYYFYKGQDNVKKWAVEQAAKSTAFGNWPREIAVADTKEDALAQFKAKYDSLDLGGKAKAKPSFDIYRKRGQAGAFIGKKIGREYIDLHKADDVKAAREYLQNNVEALEKALERYKDTPFERNTENAPRVGGDHRAGAAVTPEAFADTFGFRGVQFGNYVEQGRRQSDLNQAFDALMDMAAVLGVPPRALSLNGRLGLAFGARGKGGKGAAAAHYEPDNVVINLTKGGGPGSLAHEWWHALDNYFAKEGGDGRYMTAGGAGDKLRDQMRQAFVEIRRAIKAGALQQRSMELDKRRTKPYWSTPEEMSARSFESYVIAKLNDQGAANDYLANVVDPKVWEARDALRGVEGAPSYPYPTADELPTLRAAFDNFFQTVETRQDDAGNVAMFSRSKSFDGAVDSVLDGTMPESAAVTLVGDLPLLSALGLPSLPVATTGDRLSKMHFDHGLTRAEIKALPDLIANPVAVFESATQPGSMVVLLNMVKQGRPVVAAIRPNVRLKRVEVNLLASAYPKDKSGQIGAWAQQGLLRYLDKKKSRELATNGGVQFPWLVQLARGTSRSVIGPDDVVKPAMSRSIDQTDTPAFKRWFGDSKVVDADGKPLVVYHGTTKDFDRFDITAERNMAAFRDAQGFYFTNNPRDAAAYVESSETGEPADGANTMPVYLRIENPLRVASGDIDNHPAYISAKRRADLEAQGYDGIIYADGVEFVVFKPEQIKSAIGNRGTFDPDDADIRLSRGTGQGITQKAAAQVVDAIRSRWANAPEVVVVADMQDPAVPRAVREADIQQRSLGATGDPEGFWYGGKAYVVASALNGPADVVRVLFHETLGHYGLRGQFGQELVPILKQLAALRRPLVEAKAKAYGLDMSDEQQRLQAAEEVLAEMAQTRPNLGYVVRALAAIKAWLRKHVPMFKDMALSDTEIIQQFILPARRFVERGPGGASAAAPQPAPAFSQGATTGQERLSVAGESAYTPGDGLQAAPARQQEIAERMAARLNGGINAGRTPTVLHAVVARAGEQSGYSRSLAATATISKRLFGHEVIFVEFGGQPLFNGAASDAIPGVTFVRADAPRPHMAVLGHELLHKLRAETPGIYAELDQRLTELLTEEGAKTYLSRLEARYEKLGLQVPAAWDEELWADVVGDSFMDPEFWQAMAADQPGLFQRVVSAVLKFLDDVLAATTNLKAPFGTDEFLRDVKAARAAVASAMRQFSSTQVGAVAERDGERLSVVGEPAFSRSSPAGIQQTIIEAVPTGVMQRLQDLTTSQRGFNRWWHRTVGTQLHKAKTNKDFGRVFYAVQDFMKDTSRMATLAAEQAPDLLPQVDSLADVKKLLPQMVNTKARKADLKTASDALFDGTLRYTRNENGEAVEVSPDSEEPGGLVWSDAELKQRGLNDAAIAMYRQARGAINQSLDSLLAADVYRMMTGMRPEMLAGDAGEHAGLMASVRRAAASENPRAAVSQALRALGAQGAQVQAQIRRLRAEVDGNKGKDNPSAFLARAALKRATDLANLIEQARETMQAKIDRIGELQARGYAPLMRFGPYTVDAIDADGNRVFFGMYETQFAANRAARQFRDQGLTVNQGVKSQREFELLKGVSPETAMLFADMLGIEKNEVMQTWLQNALAEQSALKRHIRRKGIEGFDDDSSRVVAAFITSNARAGARALHGLRIQERVESVRDGDVKDEAIALAQYVDNPREEAQAVRSLLFVNYIGGSVASALVNLTQTLVQTFPYLAQFGGAGSSARRVAAAMKQAIGKIDDPDLAAAVKRAEDDGVIKPQEVFQLQAEASRSLGSDLRVRAALALWGSFFQAAESFNRRVAFIAAYQTAKEQKIPSPFAFAENAVDETQGVFNKGNRPNWSRGAVGATLFTFKTFTIQYVEFLKRLPPKEKALALAVLVLLSGLRGIPFGEDAEDIIDTVAQHLGYSFTTKDAMHRFAANALGREFADFLMNGASGTGLIPFDVSQRLGMGDLLPATGLLKPSETRKEDQVLEVFGVAGSTVRDALKGEVRPVAIRNLAKGWEMYNRGIYTDTRGRKVMDVSATDAAFKAIGLQPANVAAESRAVSTQYEQRALFTKVKGQISEQIALGMFEKDMDKVRRARERLADWNEKNPDQKIVLSSQGIRRRVVEMRKARADRFVSTSPRELRSQTRAALDE